MADFYIKLGDKYPRIEVVLLDADGEPVQLDGLLVTLLYRSRRRPNDTFRREAAPLEGVPGGACYEWQQGDLPVVGTYDAEWLITYPDKSTQRYPTEGFQQIQVVPSIPEEVAT